MRTPKPTTLRLTLGVVAMTAAVALGANRSADAHPFHVTIAEAEWNPKTSSLEVSMRVNPIDVERVLRERLKRSVELSESDEAAEKAVFAYLQERLVLSSGPKTKWKPKWVGMEVKINRAWLYFEYPMPQPPRSLRVEHRLFHELEDDQVNTLLLKVGGVKQTRHFTRFKARHELAFVNADRKAVQSAKDATKPATPAATNTLGEPNER